MVRFCLMLLLYTIIDGVATYATARWLRGDGREWCALAGVTYMLCVAIWLIGVSSNDGPGMVKAFAIYPIYAMVVGVVTGVVVAHETLSWRSWTCVAVGLLAVLVLLLDRGHLDPTDTKIVMDDQRQ